VVYVSVEVILMVKILILVTIELEVALDMVGHSLGGEHVLEAVGLRSLLLRLEVGQVAAGSHVKIESRITRLSSHGRRCPLVRS